MVEEIVSKRFYKYLKIFKKKSNKNTNKENLELYYKSQRRIYSGKREDITIKYLNS